MAILRVINPKAKLHVDMPVSVDVLKAPALVFFIKTFIKRLERNKDFYHPKRIYFAIPKIVVENS